MSELLVTSTEDVAAEAKANADAMSKEAEDKKAAESQDSETEVEDESETEQDVEEKDVEQEDEESKPKKKIKGFQKKWIKATEESNKLREQLAFLQGQQSQKPVEKTETALKEPDRDKFESKDEYYEALAEYKAELKVQALEKKLEAKEQQRTALTADQEATKAYREKVKAIEKDIKDYDKVLTEFIEEHGDYKFSAALDKLIKTSEHGPRIVYELAKDKDNLDRINGLTPEFLGLEFGRLESKYENKTTTQTKKVSTAPEPISPVKAKASTAKKDLSDPSLSFREWENLRNAELKQKGMR